MLHGPQSTVQVHLACVQLPFASYMTKYEGARRNTSNHNISYVRCEPAYVS